MSSAATLAAHAPEMRRRAPPRWGDARRGALLGSAAPVGVDEVDPRTAAAGEGRDDGAEGGRGAAVASDHLAEVVGVHADLEDRAATHLLVADRDVVGVVDDAAHQVLECLGEHDQACLSASTPEVFLPASSAVTFSRSA